MTTELLERLNDAIDVRGDRIAIFNQRLYEIFRMVSIITSIIWLVPFYFLDFHLGIFGALLKLAVTFLITLVLTIIDDLDDPFSGYWRVNIDSWLDVYEETKSSLASLRQIPTPQPVEQTVPATAKNEEKPIVSTPKSPQMDLVTLSQLLWAASLSAIYLRLISPKRDRGK